MPPRSWRAAGPRGTLRVSLSHGFGMSQIVPLVPEFTARYPEVELQLAFADRRVDVAGQGFDLAIRLGPARRIADRPPARRPRPHRLCGTRLPRAQRHAGPPRGAGRAQLHPVRPPRHAEPLAVPGAGRHGDARTGARQFPQRQWRRPVRAAAPGPRHRLGGRLPRHTPSRHRPAGAAARRFAVDERTAIHAVYPQRRHLPAKVRAFIDFLVERYRPVPTWHRS